MCSNDAVRGALIVTGLPTSIGSIIRIETLMEKKTKTKTKHIKGGGRLLVRGRLLEA